MVFIGERARGGGSITLLLRVRWVVKTSVGSGIVPKTN